MKVSGILLNIDALDCSNMKILKMDNSIWYKWLNKTVAHCKQNIFIFKPYKSFDCVNNYIHIECFLPPDKLILHGEEKDSLGIV